MIKKEPKTKITPLPIKEIPDFVERLKKEVRETAKVLGKEELQFVLWLYSSVQKQRKAAGERVRSLVARGLDCEIIQSVWSNLQATENQIRSIMKPYAESRAMGRWALKVKGIGPIFATSLMAYINMEKAVTPGHIYSFAGIVPGQVWKKGQKPPWCIAFKTLVALIGQAFCFVSSREGAYYGQVYVDRMKLETAKNKKGDYAAEAKRILGSKTFKKTTTAYKEYSKGNLPKAHIMARCRRYAAKLFLSHWWHEAYREHYDKTPPMPWVIEHGGHVDFIPPPHTLEDV